MREVCIGPGELFSTEYPSKIITECDRNVLCIFWDKRSHFTLALNFIAPFIKQKSLATAKYGNVALSKAVKMLKERALTFRVEAYIIGGNSYSDKDLIGNENISVAQRILQDARVPVVSESTGGKRVREIFFDTTSGELAIIKRVKGRGPL